jgi:glycosyltransferase involved in cell wall biosynthesis
MKKSLISVLIDTYNHERFIEQALVSVLEQDFSPHDVEVVVVDDGSTDNTAHIASKFANRIRLLKKRNGGQASAFNAAIPELRGEIVAFLDGDDWFAPGKISAVMEAFEQHPEAEAVGHGYREFHEDTGKSEIHVLPHPTFLNLATVTAARKALHAWQFLLPSALTVRREVLRRIDKIPEELVFCADTFLQVGAMAAGTYVLDKALFDYRHHSANLRANEGENGARMRRGLDMNELALELSLPLLAGLGVASDCARALVLPAWTHISRTNLATFGGSRLKTLRTEMRRFQSDFESPPVPYRLFKYIVVGGAALLLPARTFYKMRNSYAQQDLKRIRERFVRVQG